MSDRTTPNVLSIAGTDPTGGAGIQADIKSISANGGYAMAVVTALVAQNTQGVRSVHIPPLTFLAEQLDAVSDDVQIDAVKIGMLANAEVIAVVRNWLLQNPVPLVVLDPVMVATSGDRLLDAEAENAIRELLNVADLITPNVPELAVLAQQTPAASWDEVIAQAREVSKKFGVRVLAKGGHLQSNEVRDALVDGQQVTERSWPRVPTKHTHGTGCSLSSAIATLAARTGDWEISLDQATRWMNESLRAADSLQVGQGHGPIHHLAGLWQRGGLEPDHAEAEVAADWWGHIRPIRDALYELPFTQQLADGTLSNQAFKWFLAQDALYLREYARVLAMASALAPTAAEQVFWANGAHEALVGELELHHMWLADDPEPAPSRVTANYTDSLLAAAARGDYNVLIAAILPCYWIYQDFGKNLRAHSLKEHPYQSWIDTYADPNFDAATTQAINIVSSRAAAASPEVRAEMLVAFERSSWHELQFTAAPLDPEVTGFAAGHPGQ